MMVRANTEAELRAVASEVIRGTEGAIDRAVEALLLDAARRRESERTLQTSILSLTQRMGDLVTEERCENRQQRLRMADEMTSKELADVYRNLPQAIHAASKQAIAEGWEHAADKLKLSLKEHVASAIKEDTGVIYLTHEIEAARTGMEALAQNFREHVAADVARPTVTARFASGAKQWVSILTLLGILVTAMLLGARYLVFMSDSVSRDATAQEQKIDRLIDVTADLARRVGKTANHGGPR